MLTVSELYARRPKLEEILSELAPEQKRIELRAFDICARARHVYEKKLNETRKALLSFIYQEEKNDPAFEPSITAKLYGAIETFGHRPAYIFVLNYDKENPDHKEHTFGGELRSCVDKSLFDRAAEEDLLKIAYEDNAILISPEGIIEKTIVQLVNVNPDEIPRKNGFGFAHKVHSRHHSMLGASYHMPETSVYVLGEAGHIRRFKEGKISFSTVDAE